MKTKQTKRPAAKPESKKVFQLAQAEESGIEGQLARLDRIQRRPPAGSYMVKVVLPPQMAAMVKAMTLIWDSPSPEAFAAWALCKGAVCEDAVARFDQVLNAAL